MNKKFSGILFGSLVSVYALSMAFSYTSCNADNGSSDTTKISSSDTSSLAKTDTSTNQQAKKKVKKGTASLSMSAMKNNDKPKIQKDNSGVYIQPETMPEYPGGETALSQYIQNNMVYPQQAVDDSKEGTLKVSFVVDEKGNIVDPVVTGNKLGDGLDEEAVNIIKHMPKWKPGTVKGKNVKTRLDLPITFQVSTES
jgi:periplasmic protein TonB